MREITIAYTLKDGTSSEWLAYAVNNIGAMADFLTWCVEQGLDPVKVEAV
ncbi:hypothetical protein KLER11_gp44 [Pararheinheimera phage vB_PsoM_KLER1-1]|nr:hypothetical protein KLER11_gp44 [Pararheinheimera phage vB_PsoM_KLER1-1]